MSKIFCEVCGTSYPVTTVQCPICGCVRPGTAKSVAASNNGDGGGYTYVKGGRFSKANARKRGVPVQSSGGGNNRGLLIASILLMLAIIAVALYIVLKLILPLDWFIITKPEATEPSQTTVETAAATVPCTMLKLDVNVITLDKEGAAWMIYTNVEPADTTDQIRFISDNEAVATVSNDGKVTAVGSGEATVTVICGDKTASCLIKCDFDLPTEETTLPEEEFRLSRMEIHFTEKDESWIIYDGSLAMTEITWTTDDANVATIEGGRVVAVGNGTTTVYGEYNGVKLGCAIICEFAENEDPGVSGNGGVTEDGGGDTGNTAGGNYKLTTIYGDGSDITLQLEEVITLRLTDENGNKVSGVTWSVKDASVCTVTDGKVVGVASGMTEVTATYNGKTYTSIIRVP